MPPLKLRLMTADVLPELKFRPSLSGVAGLRQPREHDRVAGTKVPALIERKPGRPGAAARTPVLPELKFRPSLSASGGESPLRGRDQVLPELKFRPSLSALPPGGLPESLSGVAGTKVPALIERTPGRAMKPRNPLCCRN